MSKKQSKTSLLGVIFPLLIALFSLLIVSCPDPFSFSMPEDIPDGKGSFSLSITVGRTIMPTLEQDDFKMYTLAFTATSGGTTQSVNRSNDNITEPVYLDTGTYNLTVTAFMDTERTKPVARGTITGLVISLGSNETRPITLSAINGNGEGTFKYKVTFPAELKTATMKITPAGTGSPEQTINLLPNGSLGTLNLQKGYYNVVFTFVKQNDDTLIWREFLHIYAFLDSEFEMKFDDDDFYKTKYTVTFVLGSDVEEVTKTVLHGGTVDSILSTISLTRDYHSFGGLYSDVSMSSEYLSSTPVISDITLFVNWVPIPVTSVTLDKTTLSLSMGETSTLAVTVTPSDADPSVTWGSSNDAVATVVGGVVTAVSNGTATITVASVAYSDKSANCTVTVSEVLGTVENPFLITNEADLREVGKNTGNNGWTLSAHYKLEGDIDLTEKEKWTRIGDNSTTDDRTRFTGSFDGNGKSITGLNISATAGNCYGMFGYIGAGGAVKNLALIDCAISGFDYVGGVAGVNRGTVENCYVTGNVSGNEAIGGVVGSNSGIVKNCYITGNVSGNGNVGNVGGVVGTNESTVENCYVTGNVSGIASVGGVVGYNNGTLRNCVGLNGSITRRSGSNSSFGRVVGTNANSGTILANNYGRSDMTGPVTWTNNAAQKDGANIAFTDQWSTNTWWTSPAAFNLTATGAWEWSSANNLPILRGFTLPQDPKVFCTVTFNSNSGSAVPAQIVAAGGTASSPTAPTRSNYTFGGWYSTSGFTEPVFNFATQQITSHTTLYAKWNSVTSGDGTQGNPFLIFNEADLRKVGRETTTGGWTLSAHYRLEVDINLTGNNNWTPIGTGYDPYGDDADSAPFTGSFDGNGHSITNLNVIIDIDCLGMFGSIEEGEVKNLALINCKVSATAADYVGGVVGILYSGTVKNCYTTGTGNVSGTEYVGGVVGGNYGGIVENCYTTGTGNVSGTKYVGGVVGGNAVDVTGCYNISTGTIRGNSCVGGVVGGNQGAVLNCYATGTVIGNDGYGDFGEVGGVVGGNAGEVKNCYFTGSVSGETDSFGGVVGGNSDTVENCYSTGDVSGNNYIGGVVGNVSAGTVKNCYSTGDVSGTSTLGGVVGNVSAGTVENCYATGNVSGDSYLGGVVGYISSGIVRNCVGLNKNINYPTGVITYNQRVAIKAPNGTLINNYGRSDMTRNNSPTNWSGNTGNAEDGANVTTTEATTSTWWTTAANRWSITGGASAWDFTNTWNPPSGNTLPTLQNMSAGTQNPQLQN